MKRAVVVFSGGQDSTTCLVQALQQYDEVHCVTFDYGQRHRAEIDVARELALKLGARAHKVLDVTLLNELAVSVTAFRCLIMNLKPMVSRIRLSQGVIFCS